MVIMSATWQTPRMPYTIYCPFSYIKFCLLSFVSETFPDFLMLHIHSFLFQFSTIFRNVRAGRQFSLFLLVLTNYNPAAIVHYFVTVQQKYSGQYHIQKRHGKKGKYRRQKDTFRSIFCIPVIFFRKDRCGTSCRHSC